MHAIKAELELINSTGMTAKEQNKYFKLQRMKFQMGQCYGG